MGPLPVAHHKFVAVAKLPRRAGASGCSAKKRGGPGALLQAEQAITERQANAIKPLRAFAQSFAGRLRGDQAQPQPASIQYSWPVHLRPSSEARNSTSEETWAGVMRAFRHCWSTISASPSGVYHFICRGVFTLPGTTAVTRILSGPSSRASARVRPSMPALAVS